MMKEAIVRSALDSAELSESYGMPRDRTILNATYSDVYRELVRRGPKRTNRLTQAVITAR